MIKFDQEKVLLLQQLIIESSGGTAGVRDFKLLDSALNTAFQTYDGKELYPTKEEKGAKLGINLVQNHAFVDGNKRVGMLVMMSFLELNGIKISCKNEELVNIGISCAEGTMQYDDLLTWIQNHKI